MLEISSSFRRSEPVVSYTERLLCSLCVRIILLSIPLWGHRGGYMRSTKASQAWKKRIFMVLVGMWPRSSDIRGDLSILAWHLSAPPFFFSMGVFPINMRRICMLTPLATGVGTPLVWSRCVNVPSPWAWFLFGHCVLWYYWYRWLGPLPPIVG